MGFVVIPSIAKRLVSGGHFHQCHTVCQPSKSHRTRRIGVFCFHQTAVNHAIFQIIVHTEMEFISQKIKRVPGSKQFIDADSNRVSRKFQCTDNGHIAIITTVIVHRPVLPINLSYRGIIKYGGPVDEIVFNCRSIGCNGFNGRTRLPVGVACKV